MDQDITPENTVKLNCSAEQNKDHKVNQEWVKECNDFIEKHLHSEIAKSKGLLLPGNDFYAWDKDGNGLIYMTLKIIEWLGLELEKGELTVDFHDKMQPPGLYTEIEGQKSDLSKCKIQR